MSPFYDTSNQEIEDRKRNFSQFFFLTNKRNYAPHTLQRIPTEGAKIESYRGRYLTFLVQRDVFGWVWAHLPVPRFLFNVLSGQPFDVFFRITPEREPKTKLLPVFIRHSSTEAKHDQLYNNKEFQ